MHLEEFLSVYAAYRDVKPSTVDQYRYAVLSFSRFLERPARFEDLQPLIVNRWLQWMSLKGSKHTAKTRRMELVTLWTLASDLGHVEPPRMIRTVRVPDMAIDIVTRDELERLRHVIRGLRGKYNGYRRSDMMRTLVQATLETAMRIGDLRSLEWEWMLSHRGRFNLVEVVQGKTSRRRRVRFSNALIDDIASWHGASGLTWPFGSPYTPQHWMRQCATKVGFDVTWTKLRKTAITDVESQRPGTGWLFAGHASPETTRKWYTDYSRVDVPRPRFEHDASHASDGELGIDPPIKPN